MSEPLLIHVSKEEAEIIQQYRKAEPSGRKHIALMVELVYKESQNFNKENNVISILNPSKKLSFTNNQ